MTHLAFNEKTGDLQEVRFVKKVERIVCPNVRESSKGVEQSKSVIVDDKEPEEIDLLLVQKEFEKKCNLLVETSGTGKDKMKKSTKKSATTAATKEEETSMTTPLNTEFASQLGYNMSTNVITLTEDTDNFMQMLLTTIQFKYNARGPLAQTLRLIFEQWEQGCEQMKQQQQPTQIPPMKLWPESCMLQLKRAYLKANDNDVDKDQGEEKVHVIASRLQYVYKTRRDIYRLCTRHFQTLERTLDYVAAKGIKTLKQLTDDCKKMVDA